jgi:predicted nucleic acid-binding protein
MSVADFVDSNLLVYLTSDEASKGPAVADLLRSGGTISIQVLNEVASVLRKKLRRSMPEVRFALVRIKAACDIAPTDLRTHERGLDIAERYRFSIYDSMLLASALEARCRTFFSEDLYHGQRIEGLTIRNPFR